MNNNSFLILFSVLIFWFVALLVVFVSSALGVFFWFVSVVMFLWGFVGRQNDIKAEKIRRRAELEEEGRQRVLRTVNNFSQPVLKETVITKEVVLIQCRHSGARYPQGTPKCLTCGANL